MIKINIDRRSNIREGTEVNILSFSYKGEEHSLPLSKTFGGFECALPEVLVKNMMNICIKALRDLKDSKIVENKEDSKRIRFIGVDYR